MKYKEFDLSKCIKPGCYKKGNTHHRNDFDTDFRKQYREMILEWLANKGWNPLRVLLEMEKRELL